MKSKLWEDASGLPSDADRCSAARWLLRGLPDELAIKKARLDANVRIALKEHEEKRVQEIKSNDQNIGDFKKTVLKKKLQEIENATRVIIDLIEMC